MICDSLQNLRQAGYVLQFLTYDILGVMLQFLTSNRSIDQLVSVQPLELEVPSLIFGDSNVCFDFLLIHVALISFKKMQWRKWGKMHTESFRLISLITITW